jgi:CRP/FNR family transcriptional regulator
MNELTACPLFQRLDSRQLQTIAAASRCHAVEAEQVIFREGQECTGFYVVATGAVSVFKLAPDGRRRILHVVRAPHAFAEAAIFGAGTYPAFAVALEASRLVHVPKESFLRVLRDEPEAALGIIESMSMWMHRLLDQLESETFLNARAKLAGYLLREAERQNGGRIPGDITLPQPKKDVASQLGMAPETLSRAQSDLEGRSSIRVAGRRIEILDPAALDAVLFGDSFAT